jgi:polyisoprenyl-teichoic acid--peptidoglycan teichoic acid transferase
MKTEEKYSKIEENNEKVVEKKKEKKKKGKFFIRLMAFFIIFLITALAAFTSQILVSNQSSTSWFMSKLPILKHLAESSDRTLKGEESGRINILLLGMGGKNHDGGYLTDTIILASLDPVNKKAALTSIPRDLSVPIEDMGWRKINSINAFAEKAEPGSGGLATSQAISDILDIPVDYYVRVDFQGFINVVDHLGGLDIDVENAFSDYAYPVRGREDAEPYSSRFEHLRFEKGPQHMDGETALKFARSRHARGIEGSDFARAKRQQKIMEAAKDTVFTFKNLFKPKMIADIIGEFDDNISTNLKIWEIAKLWELFGDIEKQNIINKVLDNRSNGLLVDSRSSEGAYILLPRNGDFSELQYFIKNIFSDGPAQIKEVVSSESAAIEVRNGTWINGLASKTAVDLEKLGFEIVRIGNSSRQNFQKSVIYDLTYGEKSKALSVLKEKTNANISYSLPKWLMEDISKELENVNNPKKPDFIFIIGTDADERASGVENEL